MTTGGYTSKFNYHPSKAMLDANKIIDRLQKGSPLRACAIFILGASSSVGDFYAHEVVSYKGQNIPSIGDLEKVVREGNWEPRNDGKVDAVYGKWTVRIEIGKCNLGVLTVFK